MKSPLHYIKLWYNIGRGGSLPQCVTPAVLAVVLSLGLENADGQPLGDFSVLCAVLALIAVPLVHLAMNMLDDYFDYNYDLLGYREKLKEEGKKSYTAKYPYLLDGTITHRQLGWGIAVMLAMALTCGIVIFLYRGWTVLAIAAVVAFLGYFYSGWPLKLAFHGLGELIIGICFGPCLMCGVFEAASGALCTSANGIYWPIVLISMAIGMIVTNILFIHSFIERHTDAFSHKTTLAVLLKGDVPCLAVFAVFAFVPFLLIAGGVAVGYMHWAYLFVFLMFPHVCWGMWSMVKFVRDEPVDTAHPAKWLGPMDHLDQLVAAGCDYFAVRWLVMRNVNAGFCLILAIVKVVLLFV